MVTGFPPIVQKNAKVIILGSMPGIKSLDAYEYYAHPRNAFWQIMQELFEIPKTLAYENRLKQLQSQQIGLWDVLQSCERQGSLDSAIKQDSIVVNDFVTLLSEAKQLKTIFCNGNKAYSTFIKHALPNLNDFDKLEVIALPSTSPAHAKMNFDQKLKAWQIIKNKLEA